VDASCRCLSPPRGTGIPRAPAMVVGRAPGLLSPAPAALCPRYPKHAVRAWFLWAATPQARRLARRLKKAWIALADRDARGRLLKGHSIPGPGRPQGTGAAQVLGAYGSALGQASENRAAELVKYFADLPVADLVKAVHAFAKVFANRTVTFENRGQITVSHEIRSAFGRLCSLSDSELDALIQDGARACAESGILEDCEGETEPVVLG